MGKKKLEKEQDVEVLDKLYQELKATAQKEGRKINSIITTVKKHDMSLHQRIACQYDKHYLTLPIKEVYDRHILADLIKFLRKKGYTLDYGGGTGRVSFFYGTRGFRMICADLSKNMLTICQKRCRGIRCIALVKCDGERLPFRDASFSNVISCGTLHHLPNLKQAFVEIRRVLSYKGIFALREPCSKKANEVYGKNANLLRLYYYISSIVPLFFKIFNVLFKRVTSSIEESKFERALDPRLISFFLTKLGFQLLNLRFVTFCVNPLVSLFRSEKLLQMLLWLDDKIYRNKIFSIGSVVIAVYERVYSAKDNSRAY